MLPAIALLTLGLILLKAGMKNQNVVDVILGRETRRTSGNVKMPTGDGSDGSDGSPEPTSGGHAKPGVPVTQESAEGALHPTLGLPGFPAHDFMAPSGSPAVAPVAGIVTKLSGHDPRQGPVSGPHGPLGWSVYIKGKDGRTYFLTHLGSRTVRIGQRVAQGQVIGTVADYARYGTPSHIHMGIKG